MGYYVTIQETNLQGVLPKNFWPENLIEYDFPYWKQNKGEILPNDYNFKWDDSFEESLALMAREGVHGHVIVMGEEGEYTKYVLKDGKVHEYEGVVIFPGEKEGD